MNLKIIRILDIFFSLSLLIFLILISLILLLLAIISLRIKIFFIQKRLGLNFKEFNIIKFKSMKDNVKNLPSHLINKSNITRTGNFIRRWKIDELPQIINILKGEMSFVGPRPCLLNQKLLIKERKKRGVFKSRPGLTGLAQLLNVNMSRPILVAKLDKKMLNELNVFNYLIYILKTFQITFFKKN